MIETYSPTLCVSRRWRLILSLVVIAMFLPVASAQPQPPAEQALARSLFIQGKHLMNDRDFPRACASFSRSYDLDRKISTLANLADCREANIELATATRLFDELALQLRNTREKSAIALRKVALRRAAKLRRRTSYLKITVADGQPQDLEIAVDGIVLRTREFGRRIAVDGGWRNVTARATGHKVWYTAFQMGAQSDSRNVRVPVLAAGSGTMGAENVPLGLDREAFDRTMASAVAPIAVCCAGFPGVQVAVKVSVSPLGLVQDLSFEAALDPWLDKCLSSQIKGAIFATTLQGGTHIFSRRF